MMEANSADGGLLAKMDEFQALKKIKKFCFYLIIFLWIKKNAPKINQEAADRLRCITPNGAWDVSSTWYPQKVS